MQYNQIANNWNMKAFKYAKDLKVGDLIVCCQGNYMGIGFFAGYGNGTVQYYTSWAILHWKEKGYKKPRPLVGYINYSLYRIAKVHFEDLEDELRQELESAREILVNTGIIKL